MHEAVGSGSRTESDLFEILISRDAYTGTLNGVASFQMGCGCEGSYPINSVKNEQSPGHKVVVEKHAHLHLLRHDIVSDANFCYLPDIIIVYCIYQEIYGTVNLALHR